MKKCDCGHDAETPNTCEECQQTFCEVCWAQHIEPSVEIDPITAQPVVVEIKEIFVWTCPSCLITNKCDVVYGRDNLTPRQEEELKKSMGLEPWQDFDSLEDEGEFVSFPQILTCEQCQKSYSSKIPKAFAEPEDDDDSDDLWKDLGDPI